MNPDEFTRVWYECMPIKQIQRHFGVGYDRVCSMAQRLELPARSGKRMLDEPYKKKPRVRAAKPENLIARDYTIRECLMCQQEFRSEGNHNRLCDWCKRTKEFTDAASQPAQWDDHG